MPFSPDLTTSGAAVGTGFTSPTFTLAADLSPDNNSRQWYVSAKGGTQPSGVRVHSAGDPFTQTIRRQPYKALPPMNPNTGAYGNVPMNRTEFLTRKSVIIDSAGTRRIMVLRTIAEIPAGAELNDPDNIKAAVSCHEGTIGEETADLADSYLTGVI